MEFWDMHKIENEINSEDFLIYLDSLLRLKDFEKLFRTLKISGMYISYDFRFTNKLQIKKVTDFLTQEIYPLFPKEVNCFFQEISILKNLKDNVLKKVDSTYTMLPKQKQPYYLTQYINSYFNERMDPKLQKSSNASDFSDMNESIIMSFGMILKDMIRRKIPFIITNGIDSKDKHLISKHIALAAELRSINNIIETWMYSDIEFTKNENSSILQIDEIGDFGKNKLMCQIPFLDLKQAKDAISTFFSYTESTDLVLSLKRNDLEDKVQEYFYTKDFTQKYKDIPLIDWINSYWCLYEYSFKLIQNLSFKESIIHHSKEEWYTIFLNGGVSPMHISALLKYMTFVQKAKDLYTSPLISFSSELVCIPSMILFIDISQSLMSQFGIEEDKKTTNINQKGTNFEEHIKSLTRKNINPIISNLKRTVNGDSYEIDLIFQLDKDLFFIESKTQKQPGSHRNFYRNQEELYMYIKKFNRNVEYFMNNEKEKKDILDKLNIDTFNRVYKILVSNVYQPMHFLDDVYITNEINYYLYMHRKSSAYNHLDHNTKKITSIKIDSDLYTGPISSHQLLSMITNRKLNNRLEKRIGFRTADLTKQQNLKYTCYYIQAPSHQYLEGSLSDDEILKKIKDSYL
ncbi:hypothetical protein J3055_000844 [Listeria monocytogenes]|uniref:hypothetical protein n=1 Tax=Listeria monocytogenes TaxID=1639 RepID=UPI0008739C1D|nr:hypothetical protein [Listeria monocytogenes]EAC4040949.1 hypothetical protein [Listeria monocytogenes]EAC7319994.1 hypothetical protein [Listeria monocytogenes]EAD0023778.1 hypothetical protein [Listeria monocytogenes]EAD9895929.1 hypothetical protein [Listeria monocytogenes]EAF1783944.1 hypothetical protein [Listeria monocytogenes]